MFNDIKEAIIRFVTHRLFALTIVFAILMAVLVYRLFNLQIINGQDYLDNFTVMSKKTITTTGQRGNIYDSDGNLLASNRLTYSLTFANDSDKIETMAAKDAKETVNSITNKVLSKLIKILEKNGDHIVDSFEIKINKQGQFVFKDKDKNKVLAFKREVYGVSSIKDLKKEQQDADAKEVFEYLKNGNAPIKKNKMFGVSDEYDDKTALKIVAIRYMLFLNRYNQYVPVVIARDISDESVASVQEDISDLPGADIQNDSVRQYNYSPYFSQIIGYTGVISEQEKTNLNKGLKKNKQYTGIEVVGKTGLEQEYEKILKGTNGTKTVLVDSVGKIIQTNDDEKPAKTGNDIYLTINAELQKKCYITLERYIAGIILDHLQNTNVKAKSGTINIPITEVYYALFNNNIISLNHLHSSHASVTEQKVYAKIKSSRQDRISKLRTELESTHTPYKQLSDEKKDYVSYIYKMLKTKGVINSAEVDTSDAKYQAWKDEKISLGEFLKYAIHKEKWINISNLNISDNYYKTDEIFQAMLDFIATELKTDETFTKLVIKHQIIKSGISGLDCCKLLYDQNVLNAQKDKDYDSLVSGSMAPFNFIYKKIKNLELTPAQLALDPCSGAIVVTDVKTGKIKALVSYPSYDNNQLANNLDNAYFTRLYEDKTSPFLNRATQSSTAPGSTFKPISAIAGMQEGIITPTSTINATGTFKRITPSPHCWVYPSAHGRINVSKAIEVSCNYFFYEVGWQLSKDSSGNFDEERGLKTLSKYASLFGLNKKSGVELDENAPKISSQDPVRSAIGQGNNAFTPVQLSRYVTTIANSGTCFDLSILDKQTDNTGKTVKKYKSKVANKLQISSTIWDAVHKGMYQVVHGKQHGEIFSSVHTEVAGKTGTAEEAETRSNHALFVSYGPYKDPEISVTVVIPNGYSSANAMEVARDIYKYYFSADEKKAAKNDKKENKKEEDTGAIIPSSATNID